MGPLFSVAIMAVLAGMGVCCAWLVLRLFLNTHAAFRVAVAFVIGAGAGGAFAVGVLALIMQSGSLDKSGEIMLYLAALAVSALGGGVALSWLVVRRLRFR